MIAKTEQKTEVTCYVALLTPALHQAAGKDKESQLLEIGHLSTWQPLPLGCTGTWPGLGWPGLIAWSWRLPGGPSLGLAVTVICLSPTEKALQYTEPWIMPSYSWKPKGRPWATWGAAGDGPRSSPREANSPPTKSTRFSLFETNLVQNPFGRNLRYWLVMDKALTVFCEAPSGVLFHKIFTTVTQRSRKHWGRGGLDVPILQKKKMRHKIIKNLPKIIQLREKQTMNQTLALSLLSNIWEVLPSHYFVFLRNHPLPHSE